MRQDILVFSQFLVPTGDAGNPFTTVEEHYQINADGSLSPRPIPPYPPGGRQYFTEYNNESSSVLYSANPDGSDRLVLATIAQREYTVAYNKIFYWAYKDGEPAWPLSSVNPDGTDAKPLYEDIPARDGSHTDLGTDNARIIDFDKEYIYIAASDRSDNGLDTVFFRMKYDGTERLDYPLQYFPPTILSSYNTSPKHCKNHMFWR
jgi:hypothetical protein